MKCRTAVILPCRGLEAGLEANIRAMLAQDHPDFELLLATTPDDASRPLLARMAVENPGKVRIVLAERSTTCAQKLANQLAAIEAASPEVETFAFVDSDGQPPPHFLGELVRPLDEPGVGLVTGYRWYLPEDGRFWSYVRSAWDAAALPFLVDNRHNIAFGGAMAVRREVFERAGVAAAWRRALSDDLTLARAVKNLGLRVHFAPACIAVSRDGGTFRQILEWTNRQTTISRVYMPEFWRFTALAHTVSVLLFLATLSIGVWRFGTWGALATVGLYLGLLEANVLLMLRAVGGILDAEPAAELRKNGWRYLLAAPVATWLYGANIVRSLLSRRIAWRGISYEMVSPSETRILRSEPAAEEPRLQVLMVYPRFPVTFWGLKYLFREIMVGPKHTHPPLSLLTLAAFFPKNWEVRLVDENVRELADADLRWADVVMASVMHVQDAAFEALLARAHAAGKPVAVGGPGVSISPDHYAGLGADYVHIGEVGDATVELFRDLAAGAARQARPRMYRVAAKLSLAEFPPPRYDLVRTGDYLQLTLQIAIGCPFNCEFCEIPTIYGRVPRIKPPDAVLRELDGLYATGYRGAVFIVDDNFVGNIPSVRGLLPHVARWQNEHGQPFLFSTQASLNMADHPDVLAAMHEAGFYCAFIGIETPRAEDLRAVNKVQNTCRPVLESVRIIQDHGIEVYPSLILGLDTDGPDAGDRLAEFVEQSSATMVLVNPLGAPLGGRLYRRLAAEGRIIPSRGDGTQRYSNVIYKLGQKEVFRQYVECLRRIYEPRAVFGRIRRYNAIARRHPDRSGKLLPLRVRLLSTPRTIWHMGVLAEYRWEFWKLMALALVKGRIDFFAYQMGQAYHGIRMRDEITANPPVACDGPKPIHRLDGSGQSASRRYEHSLLS